jgi:hypothetical protein
LTSICIDCPPSRGLVSFEHTQPGAAVNVANYSSVRA